MYTLLYTYNLCSNILNSALKSNKRNRSSYVIRQHISYLGSSISERMQSIGSCGNSWQIHFQGTSEVVCHFSFFQQYKAMIQSSLTTHNALRLNQFQSPLLQCRSNISFRNSHTLKRQKFHVLIQKMLNSCDAADSKMGSNPNLVNKSHAYTRKTRHSGDSRAKEPNMTLKVLLKSYTS